MNSILSCVRLEHLDKEKINTQALEKYLSKSKENTDPSSCWYDLEDEIFFGPLEDYGNTNSYDTLYLTQKESFLNNNRHGLPYFIQTAQLGYPSDSLVINEEVIHEETNFTKAVRGRSVFIVGAGPSSNLIDVEKISQEYDQVWVVNDYRKHQKIKNIKPNLFYLSNEIYLKDETLEFLRENKDIVCTMDINVGRSPKLMAAVKEINKENNFVFSLRTFTSSGVMPRLITLASILGASKVGFVGLDGYAKGHYEKGTYESAFEGGTKKITNSSFNYRSQCREYILFWDYVTSLTSKTTEFVNHGDVYEHNVSKSILPNINKEKI